MVRKIDEKMRTFLISKFEKTLFEIELTALSLVLVKEKM